MRKISAEVRKFMKQDCTNLYFLSSIACQLANCLDEKELEVLSADLTTLGYMIESLLTHKRATNCFATPKEMD